MSSTLNAMGATKDVKNPTGGETARFVGAVKVVVRIATALRGVDAALDWAGLGRKRGPMGALALFGAGVAVGAGAGALFAPAPGAASKQVREQRFGWLICKPDEKPDHREPDMASELVRKIEHTFEDHARAVKVAIQNIDSKDRRVPFSSAGSPDRAERGSAC